MQSLNFLDFLNNLYPLGANKINSAIVQLTETLHYSKNEILLAEGKKTNKIYYIQSGTVMSTTYVHAEQVATRFWKEGQLIIPLQSLLHHTPITETHGIMDNAIISTLHFNDLTDLIHQHPECTSIILLLLVEEVKWQIERILQLTQMDHAERYLLFVSQYHRANQIVKAQLIASYLNISISTFARLKSDY